MKTRSNFHVMMRLLSLVKSMTGTMVLAVTMGVIGHLCAIFIPVLGGMAVVKLIDPAASHDLTSILIILPVIAIARGILHLLEQNRNHYLAFKLLALVRDKVFAALRTLTPAKLEGRDKGDLIAVLTSDIELLEVFYAHTISPICIAAIVSVVMVCFICSYHVLLGVLALVAYVLIGVVTPMIAAKQARAHGESFRKEFGDLDAFVLDSLRGVRESIQYDNGSKRLEQINAHTDALADKERKLKAASGTSSAMVSGVILLLDLAMLLTAAALYSGGAIPFAGVVIPVLALMSSFGPCIALANLGAGLQNTFAAGNRVLDILDETPIVRKVTDGMNITFDGAACEHVTFAYGNETILRDVSLAIPQNKVIGIIGRSGSGKSTLLKLLMRFWDVGSGRVSVSGQDIRRINTASLRDCESFVTQDTQLFHDSIERNLLIANPNATHEQVVEACKKASIHDFIMTLPMGYDTPVGELGETLSGGERQRLGIARAFLHDAPFILLDEPTSNLDSLNEAVILQSLNDSRKDKTIVLVSHRASTMCIADEVYSVENGRMS